MSRIGKKPITIPGGVTITLASDAVTVKGPKGSLSLTLHPDIQVHQDGSTLTVVLKRDTKLSRKLWGTFRALIANLIQGVTSGFEKKLEIEGVGYRAEQKGKDLQFMLGFSHPVLFPAPDGIDFKVEKNVITVSGISKEDVGRVASSIRALKKPEPYKGKGIRYVGEVIRRKAGKKATASS